MKKFKFETILNIEKLQNTLKSANPMLYKTSLVNIASNQANLIKMPKDLKRTVSVNYSTVTANYNYNNFGIGKLSGCVKIKVTTDSDSSANKLKEFLELNAEIDLRGNMAGDTMKAQLGIASSQ